MSVDSLFHIYFNSDLETKEQVYEFVSTVAWPYSSFQQKTEIVHQLEQREKVGSPLIAEYVVLPHIESDHLLKTRIVLLRLAKPILWEDGIEDIRLIIVVLLKKDEELALKKKIAMFTRSLADEEYVERLLTVEDKEDFHKEIIHSQEES